MAGFSHGRKKGKNKMKHLPRKDTEFHGSKNKNKIPCKVDEGSEGITKKVRMERLQWGFPIATALSLIRPTSINGK